MNNERSQDGGRSRSIEDVILEIESLIKDQPILEREEGSENGTKAPRAIPTVEIGSERELIADDPVLIIAEAEDIPAQELLTMRRREVNLTDLAAGNIIFVVTPITRSTDDYVKFIVRNPHDGLVAYFYYHDQQPVGRYARGRDAAGHFSLTIEEGRHIYFFDHTITNVGVSLREHISRSVRCGALQIFVKSS